MARNRFFSFLLSATILGSAAPPPALADDPPTRQEQSRPQQSPVPEQRPQPGQQRPQQRSPMEQRTQSGQQRPQQRPPMAQQPQPGQQQQHPQQRPPVAQRPQSGQQHPQYRPPMEQRPQPGQLRPQQRPPNQQLQQEGRHHPPFAQKPPNQRPPHLYRPPENRPSPYYHPPRPHYYPIDEWRHGFWRYEHHRGHLGWWWVIGDNWYMYQRPVYPYPAQALPYVYVAPKTSGVYGYNDGYDISGSLLSVLLAYAGVSLPAMDQTTALQAEETAYQAPLGQSIAWRRPGSGNSGTFTALRDGYDQNGFYCREYHMTLSAYGQAAQAKAKTCLDANGRWRLANEF